MYYSKMSPGHGRPGRRRKLREIVTLASWGWNESWESKFAQLRPVECEPGRVVAQERARWMVQTASEVVEARVTSGSRLDLWPVVGDWVAVQPGPAASDPHSIRAVLPRLTYLSRGAAGSGETEQVLCANMDFVWIVHGLDLAPNLRRIERYLSVVWESGASPVIVLTKADLAEELQAYITQVEGIAFGVPVRVVSTRDPESVRALRSTLTYGSTVMLLGPSGVGKSTLVNVLSEETVAATGEVRFGDKKGRHTTTRRELFPIPGGALVIDTPGVREFRIWELDEGLTDAFPDIEELAASCRFRDCRHDVEPGCAVQEAVAVGRLDPGRLVSYRKLQAEAAAEARRSDPLARAAAVAEVKSIMKSLKHHPKYRDRG